MGFEYAFVHIKYTIPPAVLLTLLYRPLFTRLDVYKITFLITIAVISTIPWDSYLIRNRIWSYPSHVIIGPTFCDIPLEELFFFVIQTYNTSLLYLILSKPTFQPMYLRCERSQFHPHGPINAQWWYYKYSGQFTLICTFIYACHLTQAFGTGTYTGLILVWAIPFLLLLWSLAYQFILGLPLSNTLLPIAIPTLFLWLVDTLALKRGTWVINHGTKFGIYLWEGLEFEEALFFLVTNTLIVFGQVAFDNALSISFTFPKFFPNPTPLPSPYSLIQALLIPASQYDNARIVGLQEAVHRLKKKSRSFYLASSTFQGQIRTDLLLLYSFCRVADDLVDNATSEAEAALWISKLYEFLKVAYAKNSDTEGLRNFVSQNFPVDTQSALMQLPFAKLSSGPLNDLLRGFEMDLGFSKRMEPHPIQNEYDLALYAHRVAGTVAQMCIECILHDYGAAISQKDKSRIIDAGDRAGIALQYVNIARDISVDAKMGRVYLPATWLAEEELTYNSVLKNPQGTRIERIRSKLLAKAFALHADARGAIDELPVEARGPLKVAVESYMEIGRVLKQDGYVVKAGRATVPRLRRLVVAWKTLSRQ